MAIEVHYWTTDVQRAIDFYTGALGFQADFRHPTEGNPDFCILSLEGATVMFAGFEAMSPAGDATRFDAQLRQIVAERARAAGPMSIYIRVPNVDFHHERSRRALATVIEPLWDTPWGLRQYSVLDPDGNILTFHA